MHYKYKGGHLNHSTHEVDRILTRVLKRSHRERPVTIDNMTYGLQTDVELEFEKNFGVT